LWLHHHRVTGDDTGISGHWWLAVWIIVTVHLKLLFIIEALDLFDSIAAVIIVDLNFDVFLVDNFLNFNLRLALATEEAAADATARPVRAFSNDDTEYDQ